MGSGVGLPKGGVLFFPLLRLCAVTIAHPSCKIMTEYEDQPLDFSGAKTTYPHMPGYQSTDTSREAAVSMSVKAVNLRRQCLSTIGSFGPSTVHEVANLLEKPVPSVQPRFSELRRLGRIWDSGERRVNASGRRAIVWQITPPFTESP